MSAEPALALPTAEQLAAIRQRFVDLNHQRWLRCRALLLPRQQLFVDLLPLFFHVNHPLLPGYAGQQVAAGLEGYEPGADTLQRLRDYFISSFDYSVLRPRRRVIESLFLMGSCGTVGQAEDSDLDVWLCHQSGLSETELAGLQAKADKLELDAAELGLELHVFLVDARQFKAGISEQLSAEGVGSSQHYLLLDEFYRSSILLAGRYPLWWLVPPEAEAQAERYGRTLLGSGLVEESECLDFGAVAAIPAGEFIGAGIWQLYKAISSPYKAILKLLLIEAYSQAFIDAELQPLCLQFKARLYAGEGDADQLDSYIQTYRYLEHYLRSQGQLERLPLVRKALYFKTGLRLSGVAPSTNWRVSLVRRLLQDWQWGEEQLRNLDTQRNWKLRRVREEHFLLVAELTHSYRQLQAFAQQFGGRAKIASEEMTVLGRKLFAAYERKPDKIEWLNPGIVPSLKEPQLYVYRPEGGGESWALSTQARRTTNVDALLHEAPSLAALLSWGLCNGLINERSRIKFLDNQPQLDEPKLQLLIQTLRQQLPQALSAAEASQHRLFFQPKVPVKLLLFLNIGCRSLDGLGATVAAAAERYPIYSAEMIEVNSWGEVSARVFRGADALFAVLSEWQQQLAESRQHGAPQPPELYIESLGESGQQLVAALQGLIESLQQAVIDCEHGRLVLSLGGEFVVLQLVSGELQQTRAKTYAELIQCLGRGQRDFSRITLGPLCLPGSALAAMLDYANRADCCVFYYYQAGEVDIFVSDERGSFFYCSYTSDDPEATVGRLLRFLRDTVQPPPLIRLYALEHQQDRWCCEAVDADLLEAEACGVASEQGVHARVSLTCQPPGVDIHWQGRHWLHRELGGDSLSQAGQALRRAGQAAELVSLEFAHADSEPSPQTSVYLRYKLFVERGLKSRSDS